MELHAFQDPALYALALTHASVDAAANNERLEFLGDAVLDLIVAEFLFRERPDLPEGALTELKSAVVSRQALAEAARGLGLGSHAAVGAGLAERTLPASVLANLFEAVVGAIYLDAGLAAAERFCVAALADSLPAAARLDRAASPKQLLQEYAQAHVGEPPLYDLLEERGLAHARAFLIRARLLDVAAEGDDGTGEGRRDGESEPSGSGRDGAAWRTFPSAWGRTRKEAERWAAYEALLVLGLLGARDEPSSNHR